MHDDISDAALPDDVIVEEPNSAPEPIRTFERNSPLFQGVETLDICTLSNVLRFYFILWLKVFVCYIY